MISYDLIERYEGGKVVSWYGRLRDAVLLKLDSIHNLNSDIFELELFLLVLNLNWKILDFLKEIICH